MKRLAVAVLLCCAISAFGQMQIKNSEGATLLYVTPDGRIGIGTTTPVATNILHINGKTLTKSMQINNYYMPTEDGSLNQVLKTNGAGVVSWAADAAGSGADGTVSGVTMNRGSNGLGPGTITITSTVGVAVTSPQFSFDDADASPTNEIQTLSILGRSISLSQSGGSVYIPDEVDPQVGSNTYRYIPKWDGSALVTGAMYDNGNIGIGKTNPIYQLDLATTGFANNQSSMHFYKTVEDVGGYLSSSYSSQFVLSGGCAYNNTPNFYMQAKATGAASVASYMGNIYISTDVGKSPNADFLPTNRMIIGGKGNVYIGDLQTTTPPLGYLNYQPRQIVN